MFTFSSRMFHANKDDKSFVAEASNFVGGIASLQQQLYADACDVGFAMESSRTGAKAVFYYDKEFTHGPVHEQELAGWVFKPTSETLIARPHLKGWEVTIFND